VDTATSTDEIFARGANGHDLGPVRMLQATCKRCNLCMSYRMAREGKAPSCPYEGPWAEPLPFACPACEGLAGKKCWRHRAG
jgi:hypothetical protein